MTVCVSVYVRQHRMSVCVCVHLGGREQELENAISFEWTRGYGRGLGAVVATVEARVGWRAQCSQALRQ